LLDGIGLASEATTTHIHQHVVLGDQTQGCSGALTAAM